MKRRMRGFTLMEVMVAVGITALMGTVVAMAFQTGINAKEVVEGAWCACRSTAWRARWAPRS